MPRFKDQAICIRHIDWSETSQIVALLTEQLGIIRAVAKGSRRTSPGSVQRYSGGVELLTLGQAVGMIKRSVDLASLTEWDLQNPFWHLRRDLEAQRLGLYGADLVGAMLAQGDPHPNVFEATAIFLEELEDPASRTQGLLRFQWRVLEDCGYRPELDRDVRSDGQLPKRKTYVFDAVAGGLTVGQSDNRIAWKVRAGTIDLLRQLAVGTEAACDAPALDRANRLLCVYARAILDRELPTMKALLGGGNPYR